MQPKKLLRALLGCSFALSAMCAHALAIHDSALFTNQLARNDDGSTGVLPLGFNINFYGTNTNQAFVNNNGNITLLNSLAAFTPLGIQNNGFPIIAPFWADVDTRNTASGLTTYGIGSIGGQSVFGVNWIDVGYFNTQGDKLNSFQLILTDRGDTGAGNFDIQFNYDRIVWETGGASGGVSGLGGTSAAAGYTAGDQTNFFEFAGSRIPGSFLDSNNSTGLIHNSLNSNTLGQYNFQVRSGTVVSGIPEPQTYLMMALGLAAIGAVGRKRRQSAATAAR